MSGGAVKKKKAQDRDRLLAIAAQISGVGEAVVEGLKTGQIVDNAGIYRQAEVGGVLDMNGHKKHKIELVGIKVPMLLVRELTEAVDAIGETDEGRAVLEALPKIELIQRNPGIPAPDPQEPS